MFEINARILSNIVRYSRVGHDPRFVENKQKNLNV